MITERRVPELIPVLGSQPAGDVSHKPGDRLPLLSARQAVTPGELLLVWKTCNVGESTKDAGNRGENRVVENCILLISGPRGYISVY